MAFPKAIITKPFLISETEYQQLGQNITLVGYDSFGAATENKKQYASPRLMNWVEPFEVSGERKTLFYTEVNSNLQVGDKVFIINGTYDNDLLIRKDKYKKGRDGYSVISVDGCKIALDIDYTGTLPYKDESLDNYIKVYYIDSEETFLTANRQITTRGGRFDYKFNYSQNNIAFIDKNYQPIDGWGRNGGVIGAPGFFVREGQEGWNNISDELIYLGSFSVALSATYSSNGKILIMGGTFQYKDTEFKEGLAYKWEYRDGRNRWVPDVEYSAPIITKSNFRSGKFKGEFNNGLYGSLDKMISWTGDGTWNGGTIQNSRWKSGTMNSKIALSKSLKVEYDKYGIPFQKPNSNNNGGYGFNYVIGCEIEKSTIENGNFFETIFKGADGTFSVVENHLTGATHSYENTIIKAFFEKCDFKNMLLKGGEIKNTRSLNSMFSNVKSINSYFENSVLKDSTYVSDRIIKILGYDEWNMSEYFDRFSGTYSYINDVSSKIYKFYISKESFERLRSRDEIYIKGLKINDGSSRLLNFFDSKFRITSWTEYYDDYSAEPQSITGIEPGSFYKRGYECSVFLSTPEENAFSIGSRKRQVGNFLKYDTDIISANANAGYSIDIVASRHDLFNKNIPMDASSEADAVNPKNYNYSSSISTGTASMPAKIGNVIDITEAYILDSDFGSGIVETSDWNSGNHINYSNDTSICGITSSGEYTMSIDSANDYLLVNTSLGSSKNPEKIGEGIFAQGDIVFLNSIDYDNRGMATSISIVATGSSYSTSNINSPLYLVNTKVSGTTMSVFGTGYVSSSDVPTVAKTGKGTGLTLDISAKPIGSVISITYSAPIPGNGSYPISYTANTPGWIGGPVPTASFSWSIITDTTGNVTGVVNATYAVFGPPQIPGSATNIAGAIWHSGPTPSTEGGLIVQYQVLSNGNISSVSVLSPGYNYISGQVFKIEGGDATFSVSSVSAGEIISYSVRKSGEDYIKGDIVEIPKPYDPNNRFVGTTASLVITDVAVSSADTKGLKINIVAGPGGSVASATINEQGRAYSPGEIYTIYGGTSSGNLDALVRIDSVTGSLVRLNDTYKVVMSNDGLLQLKEVGTQSVISGLTGGGIFYTSGALNRWNYISKTKIDRTKIKSGIFRRSYITRSLIRDAAYSTANRDFSNYAQAKNLLITDNIFSSNNNILSSATYMYSSFGAGNDIWNDGIIYNSIINGMTFNKGVVKQSSWIDGTFTGGTFYDSRSFDAKPGIVERNYLTNSERLFYMKGDLGPSLYNGRYAWYAGTFSGGEFYKSDWDSGTFKSGLFHHSKFYDGTIEGGTIGSKNVAAEDTRVYNAFIKNTTVNNAYVYAEDTSFEGLSSSTIFWENGIFNGGVFGSNNDKIMAYTMSSTTHLASITALPIKDFKLTSYTANFASTDVVTADFEINARITLKHTYLGDLIINLMAPNGKIINMKRKYSCGSRDNLINTTFTSDANAPSIDIATAPYTGEFKFAALLGQGVYYSLGDISQSSTYLSSLTPMAPVIAYVSSEPSTRYDGDRYLVVASSSVAPISGEAIFNSAFLEEIVEWDSQAYGGSGGWLIRASDAKSRGKSLYVTSTNELLVCLGSVWAKSYHSNTSFAADLLNSDKTITGNWKLLVMDDAGIDTGFVDEFELSFNYKSGYVVKEYKNTAIWYDGIFNAGQFVDLGIWKQGIFNGGKFISSYGWTESGDYLNREASIESFTWQGGVFNDGEFGNESTGANSTWFTGEFNGGVFKGRLWNDGIFMYGEFKGGSALPAVGGPSIKSDSASSFISQYRGRKYYGAWRKGIVSDKKDEFVTDSKLFTPRIRATRPVATGRKAIFSNMLWLGGTFNHQSGEIKNSLWLDGAFQKGKMISSAFNPYVVRYSDINEFVKDDSCIWEDGTFEDGEFHYSKWMQGKFMSGTASGMIWKNGTAFYMNAYNVFWENGLWRNGNWHGSAFEYSGKVEDGFAREIMNRGIQWSGTSSCHIWNLFERDADIPVVVSSSNLKDENFATDDLEDAGIAVPVFESPNPPTATIDSATSVTINFSVNQGGGPMTGIGVLYATASTDSPTPEPLMSEPQGSPPVIVTGAGTQYVPYTGITFPAASQTVTGSVQITGLNTGLYYNIRVYAINGGGFSLSQVLQGQRTVLPLSMTPSTAAAIGNSTPVNGQYVFLTIAAQGKTTITIGVADPNTTPPPRFSGAVWTSDPLLGNSNSLVKDSGNGSISQIDSGDNAAPTDTNATIGLVSGSLTATANLRHGSGADKLQGNTTYYLRMYARNTGGIVYSNVLTFKTGVLSPLVSFADPTTTPPIGAVSTTTTSKGSTSLRYGFVIWKTSSPATLNNTNKNDINSSISTAVLSINSADSGQYVNATLGQTYYWTYATWTGLPDATNTASISLNTIAALVPGEEYNIVSFAVDPAFSSVVRAYSPTAIGAAANRFKMSPVAPSMAPPVALEPGITSTSANLTGQISSYGGETPTYCGFVYKKSGGTYPAIGNTPTPSGDQNSGLVLAVSVPAINTNFSSTISGLTVGQNYVFKSFAINSVGTGTSADVLFSTEVTVSLGSRGNTASVMTSGQRRFSLSASAATTNNGSDIEDSGILVSTNNSTFVPVPTTLLPNTKYWIKAFAKNAGGTASSATEEAWTLADVSASFPSPNSISSVGFTANISVGAPSTGLVAQGVALYDSTGAFIANYPIASLSSGGTGSVAITGLAQGTKYKYSAWVDSAASSPATQNPFGWNLNLDGGASNTQRSDSGALFGSSQSLWTAASASFTNIFPASNPSYDATPQLMTATIYVQNTGGSSITEYGVLWSISNSNPQYASAMPARSFTNLATTGTGFQATFTASIANNLSGSGSGSLPPTTYYIRPYVINLSGSPAGQNVYLGPTASFDNSGSVI